MKVSPNLQRYIKGFSFPTDIIFTAIYMKCRFALSYRYIEELFEIRGVVVDHATIQRWVIRFVPVLDKRFRKRKKPVSGSWCMDGTYIKVRRKWKYLYRDVDQYRQKWFKHLRLGRY